MTRDPATTTRAVLMAAIEMGQPVPRIEAILDHLLAATRAEALEEARGKCESICRALREDANREYERSLHPSDVARRKYAEANGAAACETAIRALVKP